MIDNLDYENGNLISDELLQLIKSHVQGDKKESKEKPLVITRNNSIGNNFEQDDYSGLKLFQFEYDELPKLIDPIFSEVGLVSLVGSSDTGKSTLLRQLAISIAFGFDTFIGYKINNKAKNVIYVSTEDDPASVSTSLKKQIAGLHSNMEINLTSLNNVKFIFDANLEPNSEKNIYKQLAKDLEVIGANLIILDAFTDIFSGDLNSSTKVREFLNVFNDLAKKHSCLILFLHHTGKRTDKYTASKDNVLGSQAFEAKMRVLLELKQYPNDDSKRTLTITKGNYISSKIKKYSKILRFDEETLLFHEEGSVLSDSISALAKTNPKKHELLPLIKKMHDDKKSVRKIEQELKDLGYNLGKSTVSNYLQQMKTPNIIEKGTKNL